MKRRNSDYGSEGWEFESLRARKSLLQVRGDVVAAERRNASGEWTASPITRAHFERWATIFQPPDEEEILLFDKPAADG